MGFKHELEAPPEAINKLGGSVKIAKVFQELPLDTENFTEAVSEFLMEKFQGHESKLSYGVSVYNLNEPSEQFLRRFLNNLKKLLIQAGLKSRFINKNFKNPVTAAIIGENLLSEGSEIVIVQGKKHIYLAETVAIQDIESYSHRDYDRPARDAKLGMLPPKLAQMMINLGGFTKLQAPPSNKNLYDPFVGIGTVLTEGLLLGYNVVGSDISPEVMDKCKENVDWFQKEFKIHNLNVNMFAQDATLIEKRDFIVQPDLIVTESYLGPPLSKEPPPDLIKKNFGYVEELLMRFFKNLSYLVPKGTPVVISFPVYRIRGQFEFLKELPNFILDHGFKADHLIPKKYVTEFGMKGADWPSLLYDRPDQIVGREIWRFIKT